MDAPRFSSNLMQTGALDEVADLLYGDSGITMPGLEMPQDEAVRIARKHRPWLEYCLVRDWIWIDITVSPEQRAELAKTQLQPSIIYAHTVIYDSARRWDLGNYVRTSPLHRWEEGFIFATLNSAYLLLGDGVRKRATLETIGRL